MAYFTRMRYKNKRHAIIALMYATEEQYSLAAQTDPFSQVSAE